MTEILERTERGCKDRTKSDMKRERKLFEFRKRLWNEPPEDLDMGWFNCSNRGYYDIVQRDFKAMRGADFDWKTGWLDLHTEHYLFTCYRDWA